MGKSQEIYWEHFSHKADIGLRGIGPDRNTAFEQAAIALTSVVTDIEKVEPVKEIEITCQANDDELLLVDWLSSLIYEMATRNMLFSRFEVSIKDNKLNARVWGQEVDLQKHTPAVEIKGATYTELSVTQNENQNWVVQCVVDV